MRPFLSRAPCNSVLLEKLIVAYIISMYACNRGYELWSVADIPAGATDHNALSLSNAPVT